MKCKAWATTGRRAYQERSHQSRRLPISLAVLAAFALAGCGVSHAAHAAGKGASRAASEHAAMLNASAVASPALAVLSPSPSPDKAPASASPSPSQSGTSASASATATAPRPSNSPSSTGASGACVTSARTGNCGPYSYAGITQSNGPILVEQDVWSPIAGWSQTLHATNPGNWYVVANMPAGNTAVISFPDANKQFTEDPLSGFSSIYSSFSENMHATNATVAWGAYDIWLNKWGNEVMIQHDFASKAYCFSPQTTASFGGSGGVPKQSWRLCKHKKELVWQLVGSNEQSGSVDVLGMLKWLESKGYLPQSSTLTDIGYGWEICSTGGKPETFTNSGFTIKTAAA